ncbi:MAG: (4Fe-4S)-binding protein [Propionibacteriaceae bacterium]|jgi:uncharacterized Fe-S cluster protein YjdI|nr:(4Fe-4S)-binding protein [Propionibacteriaceae bacterium]
MTRRTYTGESINVTFDASRCIHAAACVRGLPAVFDTQRKPWILPDAAPAEEVAAVVRRCPTGALEYGPGQVTAGAAPEVPDVPTTVDAGPGHPRYARGDLKITTDAGQVTAYRAAFCRCGKTQNQPFCDLSHLK